MNICSDLERFGGRSCKVFALESTNVRTQKIRFGEVAHAAGDEHRHVQSFEVRRATGDLALKGAEGDFLVVGHTGQVAMREFGIRAFAGLAPDLFAGDAAARSL